LCFVFQEWHEGRSKVSLKTALQNLRKPLTPRELTIYYEAVADLRPILEDPFLYKVTMLLTLTFFCSSLSSTYLRILWRHLVSVYREDQPKEVMLRIHASLVHICKISNILMKVINA
jgi:hypothetical protein